jgi:primosomal protein N'
VKGKCKYCGKVLKDIANIRCDACDEVWQDGVNFGVSEIENKIRLAVRMLLEFTKCDGI